jgi:hypothetical protein
MISLIHHQRLTPLTYVVHREKPRILWLWHYHLEYLSNNCFAFYRNIFQKLQTNAIDSEDTIYREDKNLQKKRRDLEWETPPLNYPPWGKFQINNFDKKRLSIQASTNSSNDGYYNYFKYFRIPLNYISNV